jgi:hypothetical protein
MEYYVEVSHGMESMRQRWRGFEQGQFLFAKLFGAVGGP